MSDELVQYDEQVYETTDQVDDLVLRVGKLDVVDDPSNDFALSLLADLRAAVKQIEMHKQRYTKPLNDHLKMIRGDFDRMAAPAIEASGILSKKIGVYRAKLDEAARKEQERLRLQAERKQERAAERAEAKGLEPPIPQPIVPKVAPPAKTVTTTSGAKVTFRSVPKFEIVDEALVPREYLKVDEVKIGAAVRSKLATEANPIPGVRIWVDQEPVTRR